MDGWTNGQMDVNGWMDRMDGVSALFDAVICGSRLQLFMVMEMLKKTQIQYIPETICS